ncbi:hypothetical protein LshimejAT787_0505970 [Lyophyllum shimeji]|uniref:Uncharacterized protein n=1 Tax=Lyophyllum shimeji TaxID=47721 RepID=A0A9P3PNW1_LYOSH|nr:hypothetical protein LshimejAT787_0505970 [Lyophyllum shimeji]
MVAQLSDKLGSILATKYMGLTMINIWRSNGSAATLEEARMREYISAKDMVCDFTSSQLLRGVRASTSSPARLPPCFLVKLTSLWALVPCCEVFDIYHGASMVTRSERHPVSFLASVPRVVRSPYTGFSAQETWMADELPEYLIWET